MSKVAVNSRNVVERSGFGAFVTGTLLERQRLLIVLERLLWLGHIVEHGANCMQGNRLEVRVVNLPLN